MRRTCQTGAAMVEFAIVAVVFLTLMLGIMDFGRLLFTWNAAAEATRWGARVAVVCTNGGADATGLNTIRNKMKLILPQLQDNNIVVTWFNPEGMASGSCDKSNCKGVQVSIYNNPGDAGDPNNFKIQAISPFMGFDMLLVPPFATYLPRESMEATHVESDNTTSSNPVCL